ncbi:pyridoxal phosphate-dependent transferase [Fusarium redolens]|uniref:Ornithine aminotransferase n=1 Tax=Fusarium redolens TaxID=48865 RepID=A0A9P9FYH9_FUSRE|nr:pyridoxal phosphate-dependent transferase [Fusarium redolens]KAH7216870.1 pyridoxal phosphate-dependent transferase [Fusarium redolens]
MSNAKFAKAAADHVYKLPLAGTYSISSLYIEFSQRVTKFGKANSWRLKEFGYGSIVTMLSGSEAVESADKIARGWAYLHKGIPQDKTHISTVDQCYHRWTLLTMPMATVAAKRKLHFGEHLPNVGPYAPSSGKLISFGDIKALTNYFEEDAHHLAALCIEPVQGWAGTIVPPTEYLKVAQELCRKHNVLLICDEIQTGYGPNSKDLSYQHEATLEPDMVIMGNAATGVLISLSYYLISVFMGKKDIMDLVYKNEIHSIFGASPIIVKTYIIIS